MDITFPSKVRMTIYIIIVMGTAVLVPLHVASIVSDVIMSVWTSVSGAASLLAVLNVKK